MKMKIGKILFVKSDYLTGSVTIIIYTRCNTSLFGNNTVMRLMKMLPILSYNIRMSVPYNCPVGKHQNENLPGESPSENR